MHRRHLSPLDDAPRRASPAEVGLSRSPTSGMGVASSNRFVTSNKYDGEESPAERIERTALELFGERGFEGVSVRDLARRASVTLGSISYYFGSKEALYRHCVEQLVREFVDDVSARRLTGEWFPGREEDERTLRLRRLIRIWVDLQLTSDEGLRVFGNDRLLRPVWNALRQSHRAGSDASGAPLLDYLGSMLLASILTDEQLEDLSGVAAKEARRRWRGMTMRFVTGDAGERVTDKALGAAASEG